MFAALISHERDRSAPQPRVDQLVAALNPFDQADHVGSWSDNRALMIQCDVSNTAASHHADGPTRSARSGRMIVAWLRLDNRSELLQNLETATSARVVTDAMLVLHAFDRWGTDCVDHLVGSFSFVIYDPARNEAFAARDPLGTRPLFYARTDRELIVATSAAVFHAVPGLSLSPTQDWLAGYIANATPSPAATPWSNVHKLEAGHCLAVRGITGSQLTARRYFRFRDDQPVASRRAQRWVDDYLTVLEQAVACRVRSTFPVGAETSGGLDSSTCVALAARAIERPADQLHVFGFVNHEHESEFIYETSRAAGLTNEHIEPFPEPTPSDAHDARVLTTLGYPAEFGGGTAQDSLLGRAAALNVRTMLSGFGGDEGVTSAGNLVLNELLQERRYITLLGAMPGSRPLAPVRALRAGNRLRATAANHLDQSDPNTAATRLSAVRTEILDQLQSSERGLWNDATRVNEWVLARLASPWVALRLETASLLAQSYRIEYRWPLLDTRLVQQYLSTPALHKGGPMTRFLHRSAIRGIVPEKVAMKPTKDMGAPIRPAPIAAAIASSRQVEQDMHPALESVIDRSKLAALIETVASDRPSNLTSERFVLTRQAPRLRMANSWLHRFHP